MYQQHHIIVEQRQPVSNRVNSFNYNTTASHCAAGIQSDFKTLQLHLLSDLRTNTDSFPPTVSASEAERHVELRASPKTSGPTGEEQTDTQTTNVSGCDYDHSSVAALLCRKLEQRLMVEMDTTSFPVVPT